MTTPRFLVCAFGPFPAAPDNPSGLVVERLAAERWWPAEVETEFLVLPVSWRQAVPRLLEALRARPADGVMLTGVATTADAFRVETTGRNKTSRAHLDQDGAPAPAPLIAPEGPGAVAVTAPVEALLDALIRGGFAARLSDDAGDYLCNFSLYSLLVAHAAPAIGFLHLPQARECAEGAMFDLADIERAVRVAGEAFAETLSRPAVERRRA